MLTKTFLAKLSHSVLRADADVPLDLCVELLSSLIPLGAMASDLSQIISDLPVLLEKPETSDQRYVCLNQRLCFYFDWEWLHCVSCTSRLGLHFKTTAVVTKTS